MKILKLEPWDPRGDLAGKKDAACLALLRWHNANPVEMHERGARFKRRRPEAWPTREDANRLRDGEYRKPWRVVVCPK